jgi:hypothetical protein
MPGGGGGKLLVAGMVQRFGLLWPFCAGDQPWRPGNQARGSQPYLGPRGLSCPGDMMIDWVSPPAGMRPLSLIRPSAWPVRAGSG